MNKALRAVLALSSISFASVMLAAESYGGGANLGDCTLILDPTRDSDTNVSAVAKLADHTVETRSFIELVDRDPSKNLVLQHPSLAMNAAQRLLSIIYSMGEETIADPDNPSGKIRYFPFFEKGGVETGGSRIVGQYAAKQKFVEYLEKAANGDKSGRSLLVFLGPAGTGKSEILDLAAAGFRYFTKNDPKHFVYVPEFFNLREIPELRRFIELDDEGYEPRVPVSYPELPLVLLPESYQKMLLDMAEPKIKEMSRSEPDAVLDPGHRLSKIRERIIEHYTQLEGRDLTDAEKVMAINKHVKLKRLVLGENGTAPKVDAKKGDVNWRGLFVGENPIHVADLDPNNPFRFTEEGKLLKANTNILFWDEFMRNKADLIEASLGVIEGRRVSFEFGPEIRLDTVLVGASNTESYLKMIGEPGTKAQVDRLTLERMVWSLYPHENMEIALLMNKKGLYARKLHSSNDKADESAESKPDTIQKANLGEFFPMRKWGVPIEGPDRRYAVFFGTGSRRVHVTPHALMLMSYILTASHMSTNTKEAMEKLPAAAVIQEALFRDVVTRLRVMTHSQEVMDSEWAELSSLSKLLGEGEMGISMRDAGTRWLPTAIAMARKPENENTLTPLIIKEALRKELEGKNIKYKSDQERRDWLAMADYLTMQLIVPEIRKDIMRAYGAKEGITRKVYDQIVKELMDLETHPSRQKSDTLRQIEAMYQIVNREPLSPQRIVIYQLRNTRARAESGQTSEDTPHPGLMNAIVEYFAKSQAKTVALEALAKAIESDSGDNATAGVKNAFLEIMTHELGYTTKRGIREAVQLVLDAEAKARKVGQ